MRQRRKAFLYVSKEDGRLCVHGLKGVMRGGKALVELPMECRDVVPGDLVWDMKILGVLDTLHVVVWKKVWNSNDRDLRVFLFKFRLATADELTVETVMNE